MRETKNFAEAEVAPVRGMAVFAKAQEASVREFRRGGLQAPDWRVG